MKRVMLFFLIAVMVSLPFLDAFADRIPEEKGPRYIGAMQVIRCKDYVTLRAEPYKKAKALWYGDFQSLELQNTYCVFTRSFENDRVLCAVNIGEQEVTVHADFGAGRARDLATGQIIDFGGGLKIPAHTAYLLHPASAEVPDEVYFAGQEEKKTAKTVKKTKKIAVLHVM